MYKYILRPFFFLFDPEIVHHLVFNLIKLLNYIPGLGWITSLLYDIKHPKLERDIFGIKFKNPVGLAAGFDKDAKLFKELSNFGFGFIEVGTVTPLKQDGNPKKRLFSKNLFGYENVIFPKLIKPTALISGHSSQEKGIFLGDYVTIESNTSIKKFSVIQSHSHIGHDSSIGEFTIFGSSVTITGRCSIGDYCFLGSSVTVIPDTKIGKGSVIQAGSCITKDIPDFSFASGNPCEVICPVELLGKKFNLHNKQLE